MAYRRRHTPQAKLQEESRYQKGWDARKAGFGIDDHGYSVPTKKGTGLHALYLSRVEDWQQGWLDCDAAERATAKSPIQ